MKFIAALLTILCFALLAKGQIEQPVKWAYGSKKINNTEADIFLKATIKDGWHIYSAFQKEGGPVPTSFNFSGSAIGLISEPNPLSRYEPAFSMNVSYFEHDVIFRQKVKISGSVIKGSLKYMCCNDHQCLAPETVEFSIPVK